jgi:uncharacterized protein YndB with AHSA1/START domain
MTTTLQDTIEREVTIRASKERIYNAITDPSQLVNWFPDAVEGKVEVGEQPVFDFGKYGKTQVYIAAADPFDYFAYRWTSHNEHTTDSLGDVLSRANTLVEFRLTETPDGTVVRVTESGFSKLPQAVAEKAFEDNSGGWTFMLDRLVDLVTKA